MKTVFICASFLWSLSLYSQDTAKVNKVDALVEIINSSAYNFQTDTIKQDHPEIGLFMRTYLTVVSDGAELKKYINDVHATTQEGGKDKLMVATNTFYFDRNKLIKVEEYLTEGDKKKSALWYYLDDKSIYFSVKSEKSIERAELLLKMAKSILEKSGFK